MACRGYDFATSRARRIPFNLLLHLYWGSIYIGLYRVNIGLHHRDYNGNYYRGLGSGVANRNRSSSDNDDTIRNMQPLSFGSLEVLERVEIVETTVIARVRYKHKHSNPKTFQF